MDSSEGSATIVTKDGKRYSCSLALALEVRGLREDRDELERKLAGEREWRENLVVLIEKMSDAASKDKHATAAETARLLGKQGDAIAALKCELAKINPGHPAIQ